MNYLKEELELQREYRFKPFTLSGLIFESLTNLSKDKQGGK